MNAIFLTDDAPEVIGRVYSAATQERIRGEIALAPHVFSSGALRRHVFSDVEVVFSTWGIAGSMGGEVARMGEYMAEEFAAWLHGQAAQYEVTEAMLEWMA